MLNVLVAVMLGSGVTPPTAETQGACAAEVHASTAVYRLRDLPPDIREDLLGTFSDMGEPDGPLLQTDAPTAAERNDPTSRFLQAIFVHDEWFVQYEVSGMHGPFTIGYRRGGNDGRFRRSASHYFAGPACASIKAALAGVTTPGGFNF